MATMKEIKADVFGLAELNRTMNGGEKHHWLNITKNFFTTAGQLARRVTSTSMPTNRVVLSQQSRESGNPG
jgi:hypothetical protein